VAVKNSPEDGVVHPLIPIKPNEAYKIIAFKKFLPDFEKNVEKTLDS
jgi:hypothetical protein